MAISAKLEMESEAIPDSYSLKLDWTLPTSFGLTACFFSRGKHLFVLQRLCGVSVSLTSLRSFHLSTFRRFSLKILWQGKYRGKKIQFSQAMTSFEFWCTS